MNEWQLIETAPKDGTIILGAIPAAEGMFLCAYTGEANGKPGWFCVAHSIDLGYIEIASDSEGLLIPVNPSHWQPLPELPELPKLNKQEEKFYYGGHDEKS